jgi:hypothetical protein
MATFTAATYQNEMLPPDGTDVHAVVEVTCVGAGDAVSGGGLAQIIIVDTSGSMGDGQKMYAAIDATIAALDVLPAGAQFAVISGNSTGEVIYPAHRRGLATVTAATIDEAQSAVRRLDCNGSTAMGAWLNAASDLFETVPANMQRSALLLTDGRHEGESRNVLVRAVERATNLFQCDCRGVGTSWEVNELRYIADALMGSVGLIAEPADLAADFTTIINSVASRGVASATLRVWAPQDAEVQFVRQVAPDVADLAERRVQVSELISEFPLGAWGDETREYHLCIRVPAKPVGSNQLVGRAQLVVDGAVAAQGLIKASWSDDAAQTTRIDPAVAHYTGQTELANAIQEGLAAKAAGDTATATVRLGRAAQLAAETGNDAATAKLRKVVDITDAETGTVRLRATINKADEMALDTASTKTTRVRS